MAAFATHFKTIVVESCRKCMFLWLSQF